MKWRCTWCGKPHAENDPPCDECGHNVFEKAVVRADEDSSNANGGAGTSGAPDELDGATPGTVDTGTQYVWRCPNCGRDHVRNNPPCSRCGNPDLEQTEQTYDEIDRELETPSWLELAKPYAPILVVIGLVVALFATGIVPPSVLPGIGPPSPPDAPGNGSQAGGIDLDRTAELVHEELETDRGAADSRTYDADLAAFAEYWNRALIASDYGDANPEPADPDAFGVDCAAEDVVAVQLPQLEEDIDGYDDESDLAAEIADALRPTADSGSSGDLSAEGLDLHVTDDGEIHGFYATC
ncbi:hypothetical protein [Halopiger aswanensis]|uniref:Uncharacterized protein n=1 Tax=Halopiger aswanensis TaxID=148449 RepID=A0A3R7E0J4_9EURY|nr:hypothetical protein [Halopiger aswanensis]RKD97103.1 hypothetical protein ATJ93_0084 [Halopiger aswanensis]